MAGTLRGITTGMTHGIAIVRGGLTLPGTVLVGDSVGAGAVFMPAGALLGTVRHGAGIVRDTGVVIMEGIGVTITTITTIRIITGRRDEPHRAVMPREDQVPIGTSRVPPDLHLTARQAVPAL